MQPTVESVEVTHNRWASMFIAFIRMPDGKLVLRDVEDHGAAVTVLPYDPERKTAILVEQFRAPPFFANDQPHTLEAIAGCVEDETDDATAKREALEEAGLRLEALERVASAWTMPGVSTERMTLYLAPYRLADRVADGGGVAHEQEEIRVVEMPLAELVALMAAGELVDMKTLVLTQALQLRHPELFR